MGKVRRLRPKKTLSFLHIRRAAEAALKLAPRRRLRVLRNPELPTFRGECEDGPRPCPLVSCKWNLYLDVTESGSIKFNFPGLEPEDMIESCALDIADRGGTTLENVGEMTGLTRERIRQIETRALFRLAVRAPH